jgi:glycosyltransferase involved in cell wall biosynthesis
MKILFCLRSFLNKELGASKTLIELAEELEKIGWQCTLIEPKDLAPQQTELEQKQNYAENLKLYLQKNASEYDIVEYEHCYLPYPRNIFTSKTLFVARSQLLGHHFVNINVPKSTNWKSQINYLLTGGQDLQKRKANVAIAQKTIEEADLVTVLNYDDKKELINCQINTEKIVVIPNGLSRTIRPLFDNISSEIPKETKIAFVGSFINRKGATDIPKIFQKINKQIPQATLILLGTGANKEQVLSKFPSYLRHKIEIIPYYKSEELPSLLANCSVGIFPSYIEAFGLGILEMLAASIPVIAYDSPGPPMMLPNDYLVSCGDIEQISVKVVKLLQNQDKLIQARQWAKRRSQDFCWQKIAKQTSEIYINYWEKKISK